MATTVERGEVREGEGGRRRETLVKWRLEITKQVFRDKWPTVCNLRGERGESGREGEREGGKEGERGEREERERGGILNPITITTLPLTSRRAELQH